jgi:hypothetical protein
MSGIFISYRREDSAPYAGRLYDRLCGRFGADQVFMDVDDIPPGADFAAHIGAKVGSCAAMIVVIGNEWLSARNAEGQLRMSDPQDFVGLEVALALQRDGMVIPVLVGGANMPKAAELRSDLKALAKRNAVILSDHEFQRDVDSLIKALEMVPDLGKKPAKESNEWKVEMRQRLRRRLVWKLPLIAALVSFAIWWQWRINSEVIVPAQPAGIAAKTAAAIAGTWSGEVAYPWGAKYTEQFFFQPEGDSLFGTAMFLQSKRGIENGKIIGDTISFQVRFEETSDGTTRTRWNRYEGKLVGEEIRLRILDDKGNPPVEVALTKAQVTP